MTEQEERQTSIEYLLDLLGNREDFDYSKFNQICLNAWTKYENELKESFFELNKGLDSRFIWRFEFEPYSAHELSEIFFISEYS